MNPPPTIVLLFCCLLCFIFLFNLVASYHLHPFSRSVISILQQLNSKNQQQSISQSNCKRGNQSPWSRLYCIDRSYTPIEPPIYPQSDWWISKANPNITKVLQTWPFNKPYLITFDVVGTLIQPSQSIGKWLRASLNEACGYQYRLPQPQLFRKYFNETHRQMREQYPCFGKHQGMTSREWWYKCIYDAYRSTPKLQEVEENFDQAMQSVFPILQDEVFGSAEGWIVKDQVEYTLRKLKEWRDQGKGPKLGIVANFDERVHKILKVSSEAGYEAPQKEFFDLALQKAQLGPNATAYHIGDKISRDVHGAVRANWKAFHFYEKFDESFSDWYEIYTQENATLGQQRARENLYYGRRDISIKDVNMEWSEIWGIEELLTLFGFPDDPDLQFKTTVVRGIYEDEDL